MRFTYRLTEDTSGWLAQCVESDAAGEGKSREAAVASLRTAIEERMFRPDAVAPPPEAGHAPIELVESTEPANRPSLDLGGPGDARR